MILFFMPLSHGQSPQHGPLLKKALEGPLAGVNSIIFVTRLEYDDPHWYANIGYHCDDENLKSRAGDGGPDVGKIQAVNIHTGETHVLFDARGGSLRDPQVHYDGQKILFSYREMNTDYYHLYEIGADGSELRQLTFGPYDDVEATYLPDGDIIFVSTRCKRWVNCWTTQVATMFRCGPNGRKIRQVSGNVEHDNTPWVMNDGRILYTRWEYTDRSQMDFHQLWAMNPDGTNQAVYYGNQNPGTVMIDAKAIPGSNQVLATFSPGHGTSDHRGKVAIVQANQGPDELSAARIINHDVWGQDPYPLSEDCFLVAQNERLLLLDDQGHAESIYHHKGEGFLHEPRPLMARKREHIIPTRTDESRATGELVLTDVYQGRNMAGVQRGDIKKLLVLESLPKPVNFSGGQDLVSWFGTFTLERVLGTVPVEEDGSAYFEIPANRSFFFVALDKDDLSVKRMQSFVSVVPGEKLSCVGCHENRLTSPVNPGRSIPKATLRTPSRVKSFEGFPVVIDFGRHVQPILDKNCVSCHSHTKREGHVSLEGDLGPAYSHSFFTLFANLQVADGRNGLGNQPPRSLGSSASALMNKIDGSHHDVTLSARDKRMVWLWIESGAAYVGSYAALRNKVDQALSQPWIPFGEQHEVLKRRCSGCHTVDNVEDEQGRALPFYPNFETRRKEATRPVAVYERVVLPDDPIARYGADILLNLTYPERSILLQAPLTRDAGGLGVCGDIFKDKIDPDYLKILSSIKRCKAVVDTRPRYGTPQFRPNHQYIREMKAYGILSPTFDAATDPIDIDATDKAYWESLWYQPNTPLQWGPESPAKTIHAYNE
jgi:hypothetical protein